MGLFSFIKKQFIDVIQWTESEPGVLVFRYPMQDMEIQNGAQLVVRDTQKAMFANEGRVADVFEPGTHTLTTQTLPILTYIRNWDKFFESPFKSDVYFFSLREQLDQKWGTPEPITFRDKELGVLRIRGNGIYSYRLDNLETFWTNISGTVSTYKTSDLEGQLRSLMLTTISSFLASSDVPFLDMAANQTKFSKTLEAVVAEEFKKYGLLLTSFYLQSISLPDELRVYLDRVASMRMIGDLNRYAQFQTADAISIAAENPGGIAGVGAGIGAGMSMGQMMMNNLSLASGSPASEENPLQTIEKLGALVEKGLLTKEEFEAKKTELLKKL